MNAATERAAMTIPSIARATYWWLLYREYLYKATLFERRLRAKLTAAQEAAFGDLEELERIHGTTEVWLECPTALLGLTRAPGWSAGWQRDVRRSQCERRAKYWRRRKDPARALRWECHAVAIEEFRARWPVSAANLMRAERWLAAQNEWIEQDRIRVAALREQAEHDRQRAAQAYHSEIRRTATAMLADFVPGITTQRRMRKAKAYDTLIDLLESSHADHHTKQAIVEIRSFVDRKERAEAELPETTICAADVGDGT